MSVSPLPVAVWEARKVQLQSGLCHHCVMGEPLPSSDLTCVMSKYWTCLYLSSELRWLTVANGRGEGCVPEVLDLWNQLRRLLPFTGWVNLVSAYICRSGLLKQASFVASFMASFTPSFLAVGDYSFKRPEESWQEKPGRTNRRPFDVEEAREGNIPLIVEKKILFYWGNGFLVSCLRKGFPLKGMKHLIRCMLSRENVFLDEGYFFLFQLWRIKNSRNWRTEHLKWPAFCQVGKKIVSIVPFLFGESWTIFEIVLWDVFFHTEAIPCCS